MKYEYFLIGFCAVGFCCSIAGTLKLVKIVREYIKYVIKEKDSVAFENQLLKEEVEKLYKENEEIKKNFNYQKSLNSAYFRMLFVQQKEKVACTAVTEQTTF